MGVKYVKDFSFPSSGGFYVQRYAKGGHVTKVPAKAKPSAKGVPARAKPNAPAKSSPKMQSAPKRGRGQGYADGGDVAPKKMLPPVPGKGSGPEPQQTFVMPGPGKGPAEGGDFQMPPEVVGPGPVERIPEEYPQERFFLPPLEQDNFPVPALPPLEQERLRPQFNIESQEQTNARLAAERDARRQNRMDIMGDRGEPGGRRMPMGALNQMVSAPALAPQPSRERRMFMQRMGRMPVSPADVSIVNPREVSAYAKGGKVKKAAGGQVAGRTDNYGNKTGPYRGSPKKARELGRRDRRAREAMERAERFAPGVATDMKSKGGVPVHHRKPMYGGGKC